MASETTPANLATAGLNRTMKGTSGHSRMLTPSEIASLQKDKRDAAAERDAMTEEEKQQASIPWAESEGKLTTCTSAV